MRQVIQCLIDWLNKEVSDEKPHRILRALAYESLKKADFDDHKRRFTADELVAAADEILKPTDAKNGLIGRVHLRITGKPENPRLLNLRGNKVCRFIQNQCV